MNASEYNKCFEIIYNKNKDSIENQPMVENLDFF